MTNKIMIVYEARNLITGEVYIGKTRTTLEKRKSQHKYEMKRHNNLFTQNLNKYGWDNFAWSILATAINYKQLKLLERQFVRDYNAELNNNSI